MPLNAGLTPAQVHERLDRFECPMCGIRLQLLLGREWATCRCCGVDYAKADDAAIGQEVVISQYWPDGEPRCPHYEAAAVVKRRRVTRIEPFGRIGQRGS